jgi:hypothetical protein
MAPGTKGPEVWAKAEEAARQARIRLFILNFTVPNTSGAF